MKLYIWDATNVQYFGGFYVDGFLMIVAENEASAWSYLKEHNKELYYNLQGWINEWEQIQRFTAIRAMMEKAINVEDAEADRQKGVGWSDPIYPRSMTIEEYITKQLYRYLSNDYTEKAKDQYMDAIIAANGGLVTKYAPKPKEIPLDKPYMFYQNEVN